MIPGHEHNEGEAVLVKPVATRY